MRPVEMIFGKTGVFEVRPLGEAFTQAKVMCRNSLTKRDNFFVTDWDTGQEIEAWLRAGKPGLVQNVFPGLTIDEREMMISGITPEEWADMFADEGV